MMCKATLVTESKDALSVSSSLRADDVAMPSLTVRTSASGGRIVSTVEAESLSTLLSAVDDLLKCQITAESLIVNGH